MACIFCKKEKINFIKETKYWNILLGMNQSQLGRCIVVLKRHCGNLSELEQNEILDFFGIAKQLENATKKSFDATMFNWTCLMNDAYKENPPQPHVHWHFLPRYDHDVVIDGTKFSDSKFGQYYDREGNIEISEKLKQKIISKLLENL